MKDLRAEKEQLTIQEDAQYDTYHYFKGYHRELQTVCANVDNILGTERESQREQQQLSIFHHLSLSSLSNHLAYFIARQQACIQIAVTIYTQACPRTSLFCFLLYQLSLWWVKYRAQPEVINS